MKKSTQSFISFTRTERIGLVCLCGLLLLLIVIRATMSLRVHPQIDSAQQKRLTDAWEKFKHSQPAYDTTDATQNTKDYQDASDDNETPLPNFININTADSVTLVRLKGIGPVTAHRIIVRRTTKGPFTDIQQLREAGRFNEETFELLSRHLTVSDTDKDKY